MCSRDLPDMSTLTLRSCTPSGLYIHIRQIPPAHVTYTTWSLFLEVRFWLLFNQDAIELWMTPTAKTASLAKIMLKTTQPFFKSSYVSHQHYEACFWKSGFRLLFNQEAIETQATAQCQNCLSGKDTMLKTTQPFFKSSYALYLTLWSIYLKVKIPQPENFLSYLSQVICKASVQFNVDR